MALSSEALVALLIFGATQTGALVFFAGTVAFAMRNHGERLDKVEAEQKSLSAGLNKLEGVCESEHAHCS